VNKKWCGALVALSCMVGVQAQAQVQMPPVLAGGGGVSSPVVVSGTVPDEATRSSVLSRLRELYGADRVLDQLSVGAVVAPPQWQQHVQRLLSSSIKQVSHGQLSVQGNTVALKGEVLNDLTRQQVASEVAQSLPPSYTVRNALRVAVQEQSVVDRALANRIVEFEPGSAVLRPAGLLILDEMAVALGQLKGRQVAIIGHTDAMGGRSANVSLSQARAQAVKTYLVGKGLAAEVLSTSGMGPDQPVASNATDAGRARNRRIEFRVGS